jgi:lysophospholipase L1-like esterase
LRRISSLVACAALVGVGMISATTAADAHTTRYDLTATPVVPSPYVALGDSYSSGAGIMPQVASASAGPCSRSQLNFAEDIAASTHPASFTDVTCSGATTADFFTSQTNKGVPIAPPQLDAVQSDTRLVTMTIGGNDDGAFVASFFGCPTIDAGDPTGHKCMTKYGTTYTDQIIKDTYPNLVRALTAVRAKAPLATVVILGYPQILPPTGSPACYAVTGISEGDVPWLYNQQMVLNDAVRRAAAVTGALYVDTFTPSAGHDACALTDRWMEPLVGPVNALPDHPNAVGEAAMAREALAVIQAAAPVATPTPAPAPAPAPAASAPAVGASAPTVAAAPQVRAPVGGVNTGGGPRPTSLLDSPVVGVVGGLLLSSGMGLGFGAYRRRLAGQK